MSSGLGGRIGRIVVLLLVVAWSAAPIYAGVTTSLSRQVDVDRTPAQWWPSPVTGAAYKELTPGSGQGTTPAAKSFFDSLLHSIVLTGISSLVILVVSVLAG
jgi:ABC-type glycerol-3-phosphate transport system permease component